MITLYQYEISPFCDKVRRVLHAKGVEYRVENITIRQTLQGHLKTLSPAAKLPVLEIEGERLTDSTDICWFLEARFPQPRLIPVDPREQAQMHFFEDWADESLYFQEMYFRFVLPHNAERWVPEASRYDSAVVRYLAKFALPKAMEKITNTQGVGRKGAVAVKQDFARHCDMLNQWLADGDWLVGASLTLADISVYAQLACLAGTSEGADAMRGYEALRHWMARVAAATAPPVSGG